MSFRTSTLPLLALALGAAAVSIPACAPGTGGESQGGVDQNGSEVTGSLPVGTVLVATANVNLRTGPSSSKSVIDVIAKGDSVTVVTASPQNGYYNVKFGTETGWSSGTYFKLGASGSGSSTSSSTSSGSPPPACTVNGVMGTCLSTSVCASMPGYVSTSGHCPGPASEECCTPGSSSASTSSSSTSSSSSSSGSSSTSSSSSSTSSGSPPPSCEVNGVMGTCIDTSVCASMAGYVSTSGLCPGPASEECCTPVSSSGATSWSCTGSYGTVPMADGEYYATEFGCYTDSNGGTHGDPGDNCIPTCLSEAQGSGLCAGMSGPECEESVNWYAADGARFGCLARLKVTNQANGRAVVVVALDYGPSCSVEAEEHHAALDLSYPADDYLFGGATGIVDKALVHVDVVPASTPLGIAN